MMLGGIFMNKLTMLSLRNDNISLEVIFEDFIKCKKSQNVSKETISFYEENFRYFRRIP